MAARKVLVSLGGQSIPLPSFMFSGMPVGMIVADTTGQNWQLTSSSATVDHVTVEAAAGNPELRWLVYTASGSLPGGTGLVQVTSGVGSVATAANLETALALGVTLTNETISSGGSASTNVALATVGWTLNGDTDGSYDIYGEIVLPASSAAFSYYLQPNATAANQTGQVIISNNSVAPTSAQITTGLFIGSGTTNAGRLTFHCHFEAKSGRVRTFRAQSVAYDPTAAATTERVFFGEWNDTSTVVGPTTQIHCDNANGIGAASFFHVCRTLLAG